MRVKAESQPLFPGLLIEMPDESPDAARRFLDTLFLSGGLVLSQVTRLTGLAGHEVQNWVSRKFLPPPVHRTYNPRQFCRIVLINHLRESLKIETIATLLEHINGHLDDTSDDLVDDAQLYNYYVNLRMRLSDGIPSEGALRKIILEVVKDYRETVKGSKNRLADVLTVMAYAGQASALQKRCVDCMEGWKKTGR